MGAGTRSPEPHQAGRPRFLLVVDSDAENLRCTAKILERFQYSVWTAKSAADALEMIAVAVPSLIITSKLLDDMPGLKLIHQLKRSNRACNVPIIVMTNKNDLASDRAYLAAGAVTCLPRPLPAEDLYRTIQVATEPIPRMNIRIKTRLRLTVNNRPAECGDGHCVSALSEHGAYIRTRDPYPPDARLPVKIHLANQPLSAEALVIYRNGPGDKRANEPGMGLQFVHISAQDRQRIRLFIRDEIARDIGMR